MATSILNDPQFDSVSHALELDRGLPLGTLKAVALQESGGRANADSGKAHGLMQFTPATAKQYNVDTSNPWDSLRGAADYLGDLHEQHGSTTAALAAYNGGTAQGKLVAAGLDPSFHETKNYVQQVSQKMQSTAPDDKTAFSAVQNTIVAMRNQGYSDQYISQKLQTSPVGDAVQAAVSKGMSPTEIVTKLGGAPLQDQIDAAHKVDQMSVPEAAWETTKNVGSDLSNAGQQLGARLTGNDAQLKHLQSVQKDVEADPTRQALSNTATGTITNFGLKALPYAGAAALTDGTAILPMMAGQAATGAAEGALTPTTGNGQFGKNVLENSALAGGTAGLGGIVAKGLGRGANALVGPAADAADRQALIAAAAKHDLPVSASNVSPFWKNIADANGESTAVKTAHEAADQAMATKVADGLGEKNYTGAIDTHLLNTARDRIGKQYDSPIGQISVKLPQSLSKDMNDLVAKTANPLTEGIANNSTVLQAITNLDKAIKDGTAVSGGQLQDLASELKNLTRSQTASHTEKQLAGKMVGQIQDTLSSSLTPEQQTAYKTANSQYRNLKAVEKMVSLSNDTGVVTPRQIIQAVKTGGFKNQFLKEQAPYQELAQTASELYGPSSGKGLGNVIAKSIKDGSDSSLKVFGAITEPHLFIPALLAKAGGKKLLTKLATSTNPTIVKLLSRTNGTQISPMMQKYISKALGTTGSTASTD